MSKDYLQKYFIDDVKGALNRGTGAGYKLITTTAYNWLAIGGITG